MARPKKRATATEPSKASSFLDALKFVSLVTRDSGPINETHISLSYNWATAFNGVIAAGHKIQEDIYACPHSKLIVEALGKCGEHISFTQLDNNRLSIKSDKFKAVVPCIEQTLLQLSYPDAPIAVIDDRFKVAMEAVGVLASETGTTVATASILMNGSSLIATNNRVIFEYWHGIDLPPAIALPKAIVEPLIKTNKKLAKFGYSQSSATFYYEDESWIRSQFYAEPYPADTVQAVLDRPCNAWPIPADFWKALDAVAGFTDGGIVYFGSGVLHSHKDATQGACYEVGGLPKGPAFPAKQLALIKPHAQTIDFLANGPNGTMLKFFGNQIRGCIAGMNR